MTADLYEGQPTRVVTIECAPGVRHVLAWERGRLMLEHHDLDAERALVGLGGDVPMCMEIAAAYRASVGDADVITSVCNSTATGDLLGLRDELKRRMAGAWVGYAETASRAVSEAVLMAREARAHHWRETLIGAAPRLLKASFVVDSVEAIERSWQEGAPQRDLDFAELVRSQVTRNLWLSLHRWVRQAERDGLTTVRARLAKPDEAPSVTSWQVETDVVVGIRWFAAVWARGLGGAPDGCFVLDVVDHRAPHELGLRALRWRRAGSHALPVVAPAVARLGPAGWAVRWDP